MNPINRIIKLSKKYKNYYFLGIFFNILYSLLSIISITAILPVLSILFGTVKIKDVDKELQEVSTGSFQYYKTLSIKYLQETITTYGASKVLLYLCIMVAIPFLIRNIFRYFAQYFIVNFKSSISRDLQQNIYNKILQLPVRFFTEQRKGDIMNRMFGDVGQIDAGIVSAFLEFARAPFMLIGTLVYLFYMQPSLTIFALLVLPIMGTVIGLIGKSLKKHAYESQEIGSQIISTVDETINAPKVIKIYNSESFLNQKFSNLINRSRNLGLKMSRRYELASPTSKFLGSLTIMMIVFFGGNLVLSSKMDAEDFLGFIALFFQMIEPAKTLANSFAGIAKGKVSAERYYELLDSDIHIEEIENPIEIQKLKKGIRLENISFYYDENHTIIDDVSLFIPAGKTVALVGQSGSGKTTLANLLARFFDVTKGKILVDDVNIKDLNLSQYRKLLGMVTQESILFNDTIHNNMIIGKMNATQEEIINAAKISNSLEFIKKLPHQFETPIGELGGKISGGQKQRISIARAVLKNPPIMILDEATSALDTESERLVQSALENLMENRTSIVIAHRLSTIQKADLIVVMEKGKIIEQGTHDELISLNGKYAKLVELQNFE